MDITDRESQNELLQIRNDLMTVYRQVREGDPALFPLRYARPGGNRRRERKLGTEDLPPILMLPGSPGTATVLPYDGMRRKMALRGLDVIMIEPRGVGLSRLDGQGRDLAPDALTIGLVIGDILAVLDHARIERAVIYGSDYGAYLAQAFAALHPERVHSLVLDSPLTSAEDELRSQQALRETYLHGTDERTESTARTLARLIADGDSEELADPLAGPVLMAVHENGGPEAVRDVVDLIAQGRGSLTWESVRQALTREWLQSTPFVFEHDLVASIAHTELGQGSHADGEPLDALALAAQRASAVAPFRGEELDVHALSSRITAPTLVLAGGHDLITPPSITRELTERIDCARLITLPRTGHGIIDAHSSAAITAAWWSAAGAAHLLTDRADDLAGMRRTPGTRVLMHGIRLALLAERMTPVGRILSSASSRQVAAESNPNRRHARRGGAV